MINQICGSMWENLWDVILSEQRLQLVWLILTMWNDMHLGNNLEKSMEKLSHPHLCGRHVGGFLKNIFSLFIVIYFVLLFINNFINKMKFLINYHIF